MTLRPLFYLSWLALAACTQPSTSSADSTAAPPAAPQVDPVPPVASVPSVASMQAGDGHGERETLSVTSTTGTINCENRNVDITGQHATLILRGHCGMIALLGAYGNLQIEHAEGLRVVGANAQVVTTSDLKTVEIFGERGTFQVGHIDELRVPGRETRLRALSIRSATLHGSNNEITQQDGTAVVEDYGKDNRIGS